MGKKYIEIYGVLHNNTPDDTIALARQIYDEKNNKTQEEINDIVISGGCGGQPNSDCWRTKLFGGIIGNETEVISSKIEEKIPFSDVLYKSDINAFVFRKNDGVSTKYYADSLNGSEYNKSNTAKEKTYFINNDKIYYFNGTELTQLSNVSNVDIIHAFDTSETAKNKVLDAYVVSKKIQEMETVIKELVSAKVAQEELLLSKGGE